MNIFQLTIKIILGLAAVFVVTKFLGKTKLSQITPFDFIFGIVLGEVMVHSIFEWKESGWLTVLYPVFLWGFLIYILELIGQKFIGLRGFLENSPSIVIQNGIIDQRELRRNKLNINQLQNLMRLQGVFSVRDVQYAILEANGGLSILKKSAASNPTRPDFNLPDQPVFLPYTIISDGQVLTANLREAGLNEQWLRDQLAAQQIGSPQEVFYAEWLEGKGLLVVPAQQK